MQQGIDSRAMFATFITKLPMLLVLAAAGAILGSGLNLLIVLGRIREVCYVSETGYYIEFAEGQYEAKNYYNAFTWNDQIGNDLILGRAMELLGESYDRDQVRAMITADILSDVRYLKVSVKGPDPIQVDEIKNALGTALGEFGTRMREFDSIYKIEDSKIAQEEIAYFTWRAAFLGAVVAAGIGGFVTAFGFCIGSVFYTKNDIMVRLGIPVCGMTYREGHHKSGDDVLEQRQAAMLVESLGMLAEKHSQILLMDASDGQAASLLLRDIQNRGLGDDACFQLYDSKKDIRRLGQEGADIAVVAVIPFGKPYREKITDEMNHVQLHGGRIAAAVLVQADRKWMKLYYGNRTERV